MAHILEKSLLSIEEKLNTKLYWVWALNSNDEIEFCNSEAIQNLQIRKGQVFENILEENLIFELSKKNEFEISIKKETNLWINDEALPVFIYITRLKDDKSIFIGFPTGNQNENLENKLKINPQSINYTVQNQNNFLKSISLDMEKWVDYIRQWYEIKGILKK